MKIIKNLIACFTLFIATSALATQMAVPVGQQGGANNSVAKPRSGMSMDQVSAKFGAPSQRMPAVGEPPITRWIYNAYTVYFENNHVIHSVTNRSN